MQVKTRHPHNQGSRSTRTRNRGKAVSGDRLMRDVGSHRRCIATGEIRDRSSLLRFVVGPNGEICPDVAACLPGRGLWLWPSRDILETAVKRRLFARAARGPVATPPGLADRVEALLVQRCCEMIGLARRAGEAVAGFEKVLSAATSGKAALLLFALDGADGGHRKIRAIERNLPIAIVLYAAEMGGVFGREHVVNAAIAGNVLSKRCIAVAEKLAGFRSGAIVDRGTEPNAGGQCGSTAVLDRDERR
jgi:uncharacterized protein